MDINVFLTILGSATLIGSALVGGIFFAFSNFVMPALASVPAREGMAAMQAINVTVLNRVFLGTFVGTALTSLALGIGAIAAWTPLTSPALLTGGLLYLVGTFGVTAAGNVPLNERLAQVSTIDSSGRQLWLHYLERWTLLNTIRTVAALAAALLIAAGLLAG